MITVTFTAKNEDASYQIQVDREQGWSVEQYIREARKCLKSTHGRASINFEFNSIRWN